MLTMITAHNGKYPARVRELPLFYILNPGPIDPNRDIMLCFTSNRAGVAAMQLRLSIRIQNSKMPPQEMCPVQQCF